MKCPKCEREMEIRIFGVNLYTEEENQIEEVIGRCEHCDFDASWEQVYFDKDYILIAERRLKQYFFG